VPIPVLAVLDACSSVPSVSRPYYFPEGRADIVITQTLGCKVTTPSADSKTPDVPGERPIVRSVASATVAYTYVPDYESTATHSLNVSDLDRLVSDSDVGITLTDDGRLTSINSINAGETAAIVKSIASVAGVFTGTKLLLDYRTTTLQVHHCQDIIDYGAPVDAQKQPGLHTLTLTYKQRLLFPKGDHATAPDKKSYGVNVDVPIPLDPGSNPFTGGNSPFPPFTFQMTSATERKIQPAWTDDDPTGPSIDVPQMKLLVLKMIGPLGDMSKTEVFWNDTMLVPSDTSVKIPLPKAPWFGKLTTSMQFASSGSGLVNKVEYNKTNGLSDLFSAGAQTVNQAFPPSPAPQTETQKAAAIQAQADLIYQQQRLVSCQLDPKSCPSK